MGWLRVVGVFWLAARVVPPAFTDGVYLPTQLASTPPCYCFSPFLFFLCSSLALTSALTLSVSLIPRVSTSRLPGLFMAVLQRQNGKTTAQARTHMIQLVSFSSFLSLCSSVMIPPNPRQSFTFCCLTCLQYQIVHSCHHAVLPEQTGSPFLSSCKVKYF